MVFKKAQHITECLLSTTHICRQIKWLPCQLATVNKSLQRLPRLRSLLIGLLFELTLMSGAACKSLSSFNVTQRLKKHGSHVWDTATVITPACLHGITMDKWCIGMENNMFCVNSPLEISVRLQLCLTFAKIKIHTNESIVDREL